MQIIQINFKYENFPSDFENQISETVNVSKLFHTEDNSLDKKTMRLRIFESLLHEFGPSILRDANITSSDDLRLIISQEI